MPRSSPRWPVRPTRVISARTISAGLAHVEAPPPAKHRGIVRRYTDTPVLGWAREVTKENPASTAALTWVTPNRERVTATPEIR